MTASPRQKNHHWGDYRDSADAAVNRVVEETKLPDYNFIRCEFSEGYTFVPVDPEGEWEYHVELFYSTTRDQWKAKLSRVPHVNPQLEEEGGS